MSAPLAPKFSRPLACPVVAGAELRNRLFCHLHKGFSAEACGCNAVRVLFSSCSVRHATARGRYRAVTKNGCGGSECRGFVALPHSTCCCPRLKRHRFPFSGRSPSRYRSDYPVLRCADNSWVHGFIIGRSGRPQPSVSITVYIKPHCWRWR